MDQSELVTVHIKPAPVLLHETAALMQPHSAALYFIASDEFNLCMRVVLRLKVFHLQSQPMALRIEIQAGGALRRVPA